jgi:hypothetical protein
MDADSGFAAENNIGGEKCLEVMEAARHRTVRDKDAEGWAASLPPAPEDTVYVLSVETKLRMFRDSPALSSSVQNAEAK